MEVKKEFQEPKTYTFDTFKKSFNEKEWKKLQIELKSYEVKGAGIPYYQIDPGLKVDLKSKVRDFPIDLVILIGVFNELPSIQSQVESMRIEAIHRKGTHTAEDRAQIKRYLKELALLERTFKQYYLQHFSRRGEPLSRETTRKCIKKINQKLQDLHPHLGPNGPEATWGYSLEPFFLKDGSKPISFWGSLARVISDGRVIKIFHQCGYCRKFFFSKQWKKYHPECKSKFFSEKKKETGKGKEYQRAYRERKDKNHMTRI